MRYTFLSSPKSLKVSLDDDVYLAKAVDYLKRGDAADRWVSKFGYSEMSVAGFLGQSFTQAGKFKLDHSAMTDFNTLKILQPQSFYMCLGVAYCSELDIRFQCWLVLKEETKIAITEEMPKDLVDGIYQYSKKIEGEITLEAYLEMLNDAVSHPKFQLEDTSRILGSPLLKKMVILTYVPTGNLDNATNVGGFVTSFTKFIQEKIEPLIDINFCESIAINWISTIHYSSLESCIFISKPCK